MAKYGPMSEEHKRKISKANRGRQKSPEHIAKIQANCLGVPYELYRQKRLEGLRWCGGHEDFLSPDNFHLGKGTFCRDCDREYEFTRRHKLPFFWYKEKLQTQGGVCALCGRTPEDVGRIYGNRGRCLSLDHDHTCCPGDKSCGKCARGLLCTRCNFMVGIFEKDPFLFEKLLRGTATYLQAYSQEVRHQTPPLGRSWVSPS